MTPAERDLMREARARLILECVGATGDNYDSCDVCHEVAVGDDRGHLMPLVHAPTCLIARLDAALAVPDVVAGDGWEWIQPKTVPGFLRTRLSDGRRAEVRADSASWKWALWPALFGGITIAIANGTAATLEEAKAAALAAAGAK